MGRGDQLEKISQAVLVARGGLCKAEWRTFDFTRPPQTDLVVASFDAAVRERYLRSLLLPVDDDLLGRAGRTVLCTGWREDGRFELKRISSMQRQVLDRLGDVDSDLDGAGECKIAKVGSNRQVIMRRAAVRAVQHLVIVRAPKDPAHITSGLRRESAFGAMGPSATIVGGQAIGWRETGTGRAIFDAFVSEPVGRWRPSCNSVELDVPRRVE